MGQATEIYTKEFETRFQRLPTHIRARILEKIRDLGRRLPDFSHERLQRRDEFKLRVGDYRIIYEFDLRLNEIYMITVAHRREVYR